MTALHYHAWVLRRRNGPRFVIGSTDGSVEVARRGYGPKDRVALSDIARAVGLTPAALRKRAAALGAVKSFTAGRWAWTVAQPDAVKLWRQYSLFGVRNGFSDGIPPKRKRGG